MTKKPDLKLVQSPICGENHFHHGAQVFVQCNRPHGHGGSFHEGNFPRLKDDSPFANLSGGKWLWPTVDSVYNQQVPSVPLIPLTAEELQTVIHMLYEGGYPEHKALIEKFEEALKGTQ